MLIYRIFLHHGFGGSATVETTDNPLTYIHNARLADPSINDWEIFGVYRK